MEFEKIFSEKTAMLAPLAGVADKAFRTVCRRQGACGVVGEMASIKGLVMNDRKTKFLLSCSEEERPMGVQLFGDDPLIMRQAVKRALEFAPDFIDINMGCPAPKVVSGGGGSGLLRDPQLAFEIVSAAVNAAGSTPISVKIRLGYSVDDQNYISMSQGIEKCGASWITVHGRTRDQMYTGACNIDAIAAVKQAVKIPVVANGDVVDIPSYIHIIEHTKCDGVMIGRGALGDPFLFARIKRYVLTGKVSPLPTVEEKMDIMCCQAALAIEDKGERIAMKEMRKHAAWYTKGIRGSAALRAMTGTLSTYEDIKQFATQVLKAAQKE